MNKSPNKTIFECSECKSFFPKWMGKCTQCSSWNSLKEKTSEAKKQTNFKAAHLTTICEIKTEDETRIETNTTEWNRVLGGGIVQGSFIVLAGEPGIGKSTLILQIAEEVSNQNKKVLYFSSEESLPQIKKRALRINLENSKILFSHQRAIESVVETIKQESPSLVIVDSIQNCFFSIANNHAGGIQQQKEMAQMLMETAKQNNIAIITTGHVTKDGAMAGPKLLEHLVDCALYLHQDSDIESRKILKSVKNRFGSTEEIGFFSTRDQGMEECKNPNNEILLDKEASRGYGSCLTFLNSAHTRKILLEVQALCIPTQSQQPARIITGVESKKVIIIAAILEKYLKIKLGRCDIFFKTSGGIKLEGGHSDLAIAIALMSSFLGQSIPHKAVALGEISLTGQVKASAEAEKASKAAIKLGANLIITGKQLGEKNGSILEIEHVRDILKLFKE